MQNLTELLISETASLKEQYLIKTKEWSDRYYSVMEERMDWKAADWCEHLGIESVLLSGREVVTYPKGFYNTIHSKTLHRLQTEARKATQAGRDAYIASEVKKAELHYEYSILKLVHRIEKKGLNHAKLVAVTSHVGVNIETTLTDGEKTVRAFTIIAEGVVQRPHYRYLIK